MVVPRIEINKTLDGEFETIVIVLLECLGSGEVFDVVVAKTFLAV